MTACLICRPFAYNWDKTIKDGYCGNQQKFYLFHSIQNMISDVIVILMPMPFLWKLHLPRLKRLSLALVFAMGTGSVYHDFYRADQFTKI